MSVLIGGSSIPVEGVHHLNSVAPQIGEVVWIASDGADLWIIGTHGDPPPIELSRLPAFETYFTDADPDGAPAPVTGLTGATTRAGVLLSWDLPPEARWRRWEVYEGTAADFVPVTPILTTTVTVVAIPRDPGSGPWYYKVRALNTRDEASTDVQAGPFSVALIGEANLAADCVTAAKIRAGEITAAKLDVTDVQAAVVTAAVINTLELDAVKITGGEIEGVEITGGTVQTGGSGRRIVLSSAAKNKLTLYSGLASETQAAFMECSGIDSSGDFIRLSSGKFGWRDSQIVIGSSDVDAHAGITAGNALSIQMNAYSNPDTPDTILVVGDTEFMDGVQIGGSLGVSGKVVPSSNCDSGTSDDGIWISDMDTGARRWKMYMSKNDGQYKLYIRFGSGGNQYLKFTGHQSLT